MWKKKIKIKRQSKVVHLTDLMPFDVRCDTYSSRRKRLLGEFFMLQCQHLFSRVVIFKELLLTAYKPSFWWTNIVPLNYRVHFLGHTPKTLFATCGSRLSQPDTKKHKNQVSKEIYHIKLPSAGFFVFFFARDKTKSLKYKIFILKMSL